MKVALIFPYPFDPGSLQGSRRRVIDLATGFVRYGHEATILSRSYTGHPTHERYDGIQIVRLKEYRRFQFGKRVWRYIDTPFAAPLFLHAAIKYDAMISINRVDPFIIPFSGKKVLSLHSGPPFFSGPRNSLVQALLRADIVICVSKYLADQMASLKPGLAKRFTFVHNGVDCELYGNGDTRRIRNKLKIPMDHVVILFVGQIGESKGLCYLVRAFKKLHEKTPKSSLIVVGSPNLWTIKDPKVRARNESYHVGLLQESVGLPIYFTGMIRPEELPNYYSAADIFVNPSLLQETFSLVNLEAMASGKPVVSSSVGGIPEVVRDGETGFLVPAADSEALFKKTDLLANDPDLRRTMGEAGRKLARSSFSLERMIIEYVRKIRN